MKGYDSYKNSGIDWIGEIPNSWSVVKLKHISNIYNGNSLNDDLKEKFESDNLDYIPYISTKDVEPETGKINIDNGIRIPLNENNFKIAPKGSFVLCIEGGSAGKKIGFLNEDVYFVNKLACFDYNNKFLYYYALSENFKNQFFNSLSGLIGGVSISTIRNFFTTFPSLEEQTQIAAFLDYKTNLIDATIEKKKRLIELLKEKRQAVINEAVTKGLNPNAPMKDSGVEWLGEIPEHWICLPFRRICSLQQGLQIPINDRFYEEIENSYEYITTKSIHNPNDFKQYILNPNSSVICNENDVLMGRTGNTGEVVTNVKGVFHNNFFKIDFDRTKFNKDFFVNYLNFTGLQKTILLVAGTTTIPDINHGAFLELNVTLPPLIEQFEIVNFINNKTRQIDILVKKSEELIENLQTYRQSLISEAVTGKIDVREWQIKNN